MEKKGLCVTCVEDKNCAFPRRFPVLHCEEFTNHEPKPVKLKPQKAARRTEVFAEPVDQFDGS